MIKFSFIFLKYTLADQLFHLLFVKARGLHGISCLSQDSSGVYLAASCMDNR